MRDLKTPVAQEPASTQLCTVWQLAEFCSSLLNFKDQRGTVQSDLADGETLLRSPHPRRDSLNELEAICRIRKMRGIVDRPSPNFP